MPRGTYIDTGQLFINMQYPAVEQMRALLETEYASAADIDAMRMLVQQNAERSIMIRVGRAVVYALAKQLMKEWGQWRGRTAPSHLKVLALPPTIITTRSKLPAAH
ncbi:MAG: hypothetical protein WDO70_04490 [Alphaproteobacteria bacterium]